MTVAISSGSLLQLIDMLIPEEKATMRAAHLEAAAIATDVDHREGATSATFKRAKVILDKKLTTNGLRLGDQHYAEMVSHINSAL
jgi:hypothetical protein